MSTEQNPNKKGFLNDLIQSPNTTPRSDDDQPKSILQSLQKHVDKKHSRHSNTSKHSKSSTTSKSNETLTDSSVKFQSKGTIAEYSSESLIVSAVDIKSLSDQPGIYAI
ncbi:uncharacterized protein LOC123290390 [Chrysoperla carnea]|uniref:uncharacterized protein LOC123290390 n=1 Tax=Chrysoperla carnea TaxID=189513 RepID=UPI001D080B8C|nr:uncharacterized protein LOC123290390 [Chrysoperla carnea]